MGIKLNEEKRKCCIMDNGPIIELGCITGPVYNCLLTTEQIINLVSNKKHVYEINPLNTMEKVLLTMGTCESSVFKLPEKQEIPEPIIPPLEKVEQIVSPYKGMSKAERKKMKYQKNNPQGQDKNNINKTGFTHVIPLENVDESPISTLTSSTITVFNENDNTNPVATEEAVTSVDF